MVELASENVTELEPFTLNCIALNLPTPQVSWLKDNALLITEDSSALQRVTVSQITVTDYHLVSVITVEGAQPGVDDGEYQCRIDNAITSGAAVFQSINIEVMGKCDINAH